jgi:hypothetical protein
MKTKQLKRIAIKCLKTTIPIIGVALFCGFIVPKITNDPLICGSISFLIGVPVGFASVMWSNWYDL